MVFGEGLPVGRTIGGKAVDYFSGALDIVAHELTHGLLDYSSNLIYRNESGALNESFADLIGTSVEFFYQPPGSGPRQADYLAGEDVFRPGGIRSLADPGAFGDPDHYSRRYTGSRDGGGVHTNSGIPNHAFYLAIEGGTNRTSGLSVTGVGGANREQIEKAFYRAFVFMLTPNATFSSARTATVQAARELYGANSAAERAITQAWTAVGVN
jgi:thermolysin